MKIYRSVVKGGLVERNLSLAVLKTFYLQQGGAASFLNPVLYKCGGRLQWHLARNHSGVSQMKTIPPNGRLQFPRNSKWTNKNTKNTSPYCSFGVIQKTQQSDLALGTNVFSPIIHCSLLDRSVFMWAPEDQLEHHPDAYVYLELAV